jgi:hypothetical protein
MITDIIKNAQILKVIFPVILIVNVQMIQKHKAFRQNGNCIFTFFKIYGNAFPNPGAGISGTPEFDIANRFSINIQFDGSHIVAI